MADLSEIVRAHQPDEARPGKTALERDDRIRRVVGAEPRLDVGDLDMRIRRHRSGRRDAISERRHAARRLQRVLWRDQPPDLIERQPSQRLAADMEMTAVSGIERAAKQADTPPAAVAERARKRQDGCLQGRTCPLPRTMYL